MPSVGNCCTLVDLQFVFITPLNDFFFNNISLKNSLHYIVHFTREMYWWVCWSAVVELLYFQGIKNKCKTENEKGIHKTIISREGLTAFLFWSLLHIKPGCDYSQIVLSGNTFQMKQHSPLLFFFLSFPLTFFFSLLFWGGGKERWCVPDTAVLAHPSGIW